MKSCMTMKGKNNVMLSFGYLVALCSILLVSCESGDDFNTATPGEYFPLDEKYRWEYVREHRYDCSCPDSGLVIIDTSNLRVSHKYTLMGNTIYVISDQQGSAYDRFAYQWIRKNGLEYYEYPAYAWEIKFLDVSKPVNSSWTVYEADSLTATKFTILSVNGIKTVNGITYQNVIEVSKVPQIVNPEINRFRPTTLYYYARNVGLIYSIETRKEDRSTFQLTLIKHSIL